MKNYMKDTTNDKAYRLALISKQYFGDEKIDLKTAKSLIREFKRELINLNKLY